MARVVIREQDLTGNVYDQDFTDIAFVPGFVKYPKEEYSSPQLVFGEGQFVEMFGPEPALLNSNFKYTVKYDGKEVLNPETGNQLFFLDASVFDNLTDCAYHYARELVYRGLPIYYCPVNEKEKDDQGRWTGRLKAYDGNQGVDGDPSIEASTGDGQSLSATLKILPKNSSEELVISSQPSSEKFKLDNSDESTAEVVGGVQAQTVAFQQQVTYTVQVEGTNVERFRYVWTIKGPGNDNKEEIISTNRICKFNTDIFPSEVRPGDYTIKVKVTADKGNANNLEEMEVEKSAEVLTTKQIIDIARSKAIDKALEEINSKFGQEIIDFFKADENVELIKDRGLYNFKYMTTGGYPLFQAGVVKSDGDSEEFDGWQRALTNLLSVCGQKTVDDSKDYIAEDGSITRQGRGDCVLLIDHMYDKAQDTMDLYEQARIFFEDSTNVNAETLEFASMFTPWANYGMTYTTHAVNVNLPASFAYLSCLADSIQAYDNWRAIAGVTRGTVKNINEILLVNPLTNTKANKCQTDPETAEPGRISINCITEIKPYGQVIWGNRTLQRADVYKHVTAMGFLNLRNEVSDIKKLVYRAARRWMFEQNTSILWINFKSTITPLLERMVHGYGLSRYEIKRGEKTKKHKLYAEIRIWPIYAVEYIDVTIQILDEETIVTEE